MNAKVTYWLERISDAIRNTPRTRPLTEAIDRITKLAQKELSPAEFKTFHRESNRRIDGLIDRLAMESNPGRPPATAREFFEKQAEWDESHVQPAVELSNLYSPAEALTVLAQELDDPDHIAHWKSQNADEIESYGVDPATAYGWWRNVYFAASKQRLRSIKDNPARRTQRQARLANPALGHKYVLGTYAKGSRVQLGNWEQHGRHPGMLMPSDWVTVVLNSADTTGVVVVKNDRNGATHELDGRSPLFEVDPMSSTRQHQKRNPGRRTQRRRNPCVGPEVREAAVSKFREFHRFEPTKITEFAKGFAIPTEMQPVGRAKSTTYRSGKVDPETGKKPRKPIDYIHEHDAGVLCYLPVDDPDLDELEVEHSPMSVPQKFAGAEALVKLGESLGTAFQVDGDDEPWDIESMSPLPELYCTPDGKCLLVIQDRREVLAMIWGGALGVFARGIDG